MLAIPSASNRRLDPLGGRRVRYRLLGQLIQAKLPKSDVCRMAMWPSLQGSIDTTRETRGRLRVPSASRGTSPRVEGASSLWLLLKAFHQVTGGDVQVMSERSRWSTQPRRSVEGQRLDQPTFHSLYEAMRPGNRAELIGGVRTGARSRRPRTWPSPRSGDRLVLRLKSSRVLSSKTDRRRRHLPIGGFSRVVVRPHGHSSRATGGDFAP